MENGDMTRTFKERISHAGRLPIICALAGLALAGSAAIAPSQAGVVTYTSESSFLAALTGDDIETFGGLITNGTTDQLFGSPVTFHPSIGTVYSSPSPIGDQIYGNSAGYYYDASNAAVSINFTGVLLAGGVEAVGLDYDASQSASATVNAGGTNYSETLSPGGTVFGTPTFIGFISSAPITSFSLAQSGASVFIQQVDMGTTTPVPEPSGLGVFAVGAHVVGGLEVRRRRNAAAL
jgi:hypothetical protein